MIEAVQYARGDVSCPDAARTRAHPTPTAPTSTPTAVVDLVNEFLLAKARAGRSDNYLGLLYKQLRAFALERAQTPAGGVTASEIEAWLYAQPWADKTRHGHLLTLRTLFDFGIGRGFVSSNPALAVDLPTLAPVERGVHSPAQVRQVLAACQDPHTLRFLAIRYFAGLRASEAAALSEEEVRQEFILVSAAKAKTRQRRLVTIQPNLRKWLEVSHARGGRLPLRQANNRLCVAIKAAAVPWPDNVTRHSFCSYHLAHFGNAGRTAMEAGHTEEMLFRHYRELMTVNGALITPSVAREFWEIKPGND